MIGIGRGLIMKSKNDSQDIIVLQKILNSLGNGQKVFYEELGIQKKSKF